MNPEEKIRIYTEELLKWNKKINLISRRSEAEVEEVHIKDSLALRPYLKEEGIGAVVDIGSGGGLPAIPLSVYLPEKHFILTDVIAKKINFLRWIIARLELNAEVVDASKNFVFTEKCVISSRAYSELSNILEWQRKHAPYAERFYLLKGTTDNTLKEAEKSGIDNFELIERDRGTILIFPKRLS